MSNGNGNGEIRIGTDTVKMGLAQMLKGGVIVSYCPIDPGETSIATGFNCIHWWMDARNVQIRDVTL
jgi:hypothetical protein